VGAQGAGMQAAWLARKPGDDRQPWTHGARPQLVVPDLLALCRALGAD
jgi:putative hydrolase of the HAD superfamily